MPIYIEKGWFNSTIKENKIELIHITPIEWLKKYTAEKVLRGTMIVDAEANKMKEKYPYIDDEIAKYYAKMEGVKDKQLYFMYGSIERDENNKLIRNIDNITRRGVITLDYDDRDTPSLDEFVSIIKEKKPNVECYIYPTIKYTDEFPRWRVVFETDRPLLEYEYKIVAKELADTIGIEYDKSVINDWQKFAGLPVITPKNAHITPIYIEGEKLKTPDIKDIKPPQKKPIAPAFTRVDDNREFIPYNDAVKIFEEYIKQDEANLSDYDNSLSATIVLAKAVQCNEIDYDTALKCVELLAMGNVAWFEENRKKLNRELKNDKLRTAYTFKRKFYDLFHKEEIKTMKDVEMRLSLRGKELRAINSETKRNGEAKESKIPQILIAHTLATALPFVMIGDGISKDKSVLHYWNYDTKLYVSSEIDIHNLILRVEPKAVRKDWADIIGILKTLAEKVTPEESRYLIPVQNGIYNQQTRQLEPFDPKYIITSKIATPYNPNAEKPKDFDVDEWFSSLACGNEEVVTLLWQMINEAINANYTRGKVGILYGPSGNNGKSTYNALTMNVIGRENVSTLKPPEFGEKFKVSQINGKVANIGEEISDAYIDDIHNLMCIATGDPITVEEKGKPPFTLISKAFCVFSGNSLPRTRNKDGWGRRALIIPFYADFSGQVNDPRIKDEYIKRQDVKEYVLKKAIEMDFDKFIIPKVVQEEIENYQLENDNVRAYIQEEYIENDYHLRKYVPIDIIKEDYLNWLESKKLKRGTLYGFGKAFVEKLKKMTGIRYKLDKVRVSIEQLEGLPQIARKYKSTSVRNAIINLDV